MYRTRYTPPRAYLAPASYERRTRCLKWGENAMLVVLFVAFAVLSLLTGMFYQAVYEDTTVFHPPYHPDIRLGTQLPLFTACGALAWLVATCCFHYNFWQHRRQWWLVLAFVRVVTAALLIASAVLQAHFLPRPLGSCANEDVWPEGSGVPPDTPTAWQLIRPLRIVTAGRLSHHSACGFLQHVRRFEIAIAVALLLCAMGEVYAFSIISHSPSPLRPSSKPEKDSPGRRAVAPRIRFALAKYRRQQEGSGKEAAPGFMAPWIRRQGYMPIQSARPTDHELGDMTDTSRQTCRCGRSAKGYRCWGCAMQSCRDCVVLTTRERPALTHSKCQIACSDCFYQYCCDTESSQSWTKPLTCTEHGDAVKRAGVHDYPASAIDMNLCRERCAKLSPMELFLLRDTREREGIAEPLLCSLDCMHCGAACRQGERVHKLYWWCCPFCRRMCRDDIHVAK